LGGLLGLAISVGWLAFSIGGISVLARIVSSIPTSNAANQYAIEYQSGPGSLLLRSLAIMSPVAALFFLLGSGVVFLSQRRLSVINHFAEQDADWPVMRGVTLFAFAYLIWPMLVAGCLNLRYISVLFGIYYLIAGIGFWYLLSLRRTRLRGVAWNVSAGLAIVALLLAGATDYLRFERFFVRDDLQDLSVGLLLDPDNPKNSIHVSFPAAPPLAATPGERASEAEAERDAREGDALLRAGKIPEAMSRYEKALAFKPDLISTLNNFSWALSTAPEGSLRNGAKALQLAEKALRLGGGESPVHLRTLAAAYAESSRFEDAIETAQRASELARAQENFTLVTSVQKDLARYRRHLPLHSVGLTNARQQ
jgi:hypothetical protein